jgi:hypothetical protein
LANNLPENGNNVATSTRNDLRTNSANTAENIRTRAISRKLVAPEDYQRTIEKRRADAKTLVNSGMSRRKTAKALGVSKDTIRRDVAHNAPNSGAQCATPTRALLAQSDQNDWRTPRKYLDAARAVTHRDASCMQPRVAATLAA